MTTDTVTLDEASEHFGIAPGEEFVVEGMPGEEPGKRHRLIEYIPISEQGVAVMGRFGIHVTVPIGVSAWELESVRLERGHVVEAGAKYRAFPAEFIRVPGIRADGPAACDACGGPGTKERKVRFSRSDGKRLHPDCRREGS